HDRECLGWMPKASGGRTPRCTGLLFVQKPISGSADSSATPGQPDRLPLKAYWWTPKVE
ncbi:hypothetical protein DSO57_1029027, partial [Entomophthora muscae]